jgi:N-acetylglutamate synthase-like GNAT family acetyltransferase
VPGCAARPEAIIDGVVKALGVLEEKYRDMTAAAHSIDKMLYLRAEASDAPEILALQKVSYQSEAEIYGDDSLPALQQTLEDLQNDFERMVFVKAVVNGKIIGAVRGYVEGQTAHLRRVVVHPYFRRRGIGRRLLDEIEQAFPEVTRFEAKTGHQSKRNLYQLGKRGYQVFQTEPFTPAITWVCLRKERKPAVRAEKAASQP